MFRFRKSSVVLLLFFGLVITFSILLIDFSNEELPGSNEYVSGAYEALNYFGLSRTYPFDFLPAEAHYAAWAKMKKVHSPLKNKPETKWTSIGPDNFGGRTLELAFNPQNPQTVYAGSASGGLWRSHTGGIGAQAWIYVPTGFPVLSVSSIAFPPDDSLTIYIGTGEVYNFKKAGSGAAFRSTRGSYGMGILKSADSGQTWEKSLDWSYNQNRGIWDIKVSRNNPDVIYTATTEGVYKSEHAGDNWTQVHNVPMANSLLIHPDNDKIVIVGVGNFSSIGKGVYKSKDGGISWDKIDSNLPTGFNGKIQLEAAPSEPNTVYASIGNGFGFEDGATWTCKSTDFGSNWEVISTRDYSRWQGWFAHDVAVDLHSPNSLMTAGIGVWKSSEPDTGLMQITSSGLGFRNPPLEGPDGPANYVHSDVHDILVHPENRDIIYIASDGGIHVTEDGGQSFHSRNGGYRSVQFYNGTSTSQINPNFYIGGLQDNGTIAYSGTTQWTRLTGGDGSWSHIDPSNDLDIITSSQGLNMRRSVDGGENFNTIRPLNQNENTAFIAPFIASPTNGNLLYAARSRIYKSRDRGDNWTEGGLNRPLDGNNPILSMAMSPQNSEVVYAASAPTTIFGGNRGQVFVTRDGGLIWKVITGLLPLRFSTDIAVDPSNEAAAYIAFSGFGSGHLYKTTDYGTSWKDISLDLPDVPLNAIVIDPESSRVIYVGSDLGVFVTTDAGETWQSFNTGLYEAVMVFDLVVSPVNRKLRLASHGNGAFERDMLEVSSLFASNTSFAMKVYPNPVNVVLNLSYKISEEEFIQGRLFDMTGRTVLTFISAVKSPGEYQEKIDVSQLMAGQYILQLSNDSSVLNEKVMVIK